MDPISNGVVITVFAVGLAMGLLTLIVVSEWLNERTEKLLANYFNGLEEKLSKLGEEVIEENDRGALVVSLIQSSHTAPENFNQTTEWITELSLIVQKFMGALGYHKDKIFRAPQIAILHLAAMRSPVIKLINESGVALESKFDAFTKNPIENEENSKLFDQMAYFLNTHFKPCLE